MKQVFPLSMEKCRVLLNAIPTGMFFEYAQGKFIVEVALHCGIPGKENVQVVHVPLESVSQQGQPKEGGTSEVMCHLSIGGVVCADRQRLEARVAELETILNTANMATAFVLQSIRTFIEHDWPKERLLKTLGWDKPKGDTGGRR